MAITYKSDNTSGKEKSRTELPKPLRSLGRLVLFLVSVGHPVRVLIIQSNQYTLR